MIYAIFEDEVDLYFARARVLERMNLMSKLLPPGVVPTLGPDATGVGHVFWYTVESSSHSLRDLRSLQDWFIRYRLNGVSGVAEVASVGGHVQQYQIDVDPHRLRGFGLALGDVVRAVQQSNANVGGNVLESKRHVVDRARHRPRAVGERSCERQHRGRKRRAGIRAAGG